MEAVQRKTGQIVIEADLLAPALDLVAGIALSAQTALVNIVRLVAVKAGPHGRIFLHSTGMASVTGGLAMGPTQRELGVLVVIEGGFSPVPGGMAVLAALAVAPLVGIVCLMTVDTGGGQF